MPTLLLSVAIVLLWSTVSGAQDGRATLETLAKALGANGLKSIEVTGSGATCAVGQSAAPGMPWPRFNLKHFTRAVNYETASLRDEIVRTQALDPPRGGGFQPVRGEQRQVFVLSGDLAWNVAGGAATPVPITRDERQVQLWTTPHGFVKAAMAHNATVQDRAISFTVAGRFVARALVDERGLIERVDAELPHPVLGRMRVEITYADYRDFGGVHFPMKIRQSAGGFPSLDLDVADVRPNVAVDIQVPDTVRQATSPYARVTSEPVTDGVYYLTGGSHHSVAIEMKDYVIVVEAPLNDERALAVIAEVRRLVPNKRLRYLVNSHHHFDHAGGVRAFAGHGVRILTHETNSDFLHRAADTPTALRADYLTRSGRHIALESVRDLRVLTDGTRTVEIRHIAGNLHADGLLMVYLPNEKLLIQADAYTPPPLDAPAPTAVNPFSANLLENITKQGLSVDRLLPLHGRIVPLSELHKAVGHSH